MAKKKSKKNFPRFIVLILMFTAILVCAGGALFNFLYPSKEVNEKIQTIAFYDEDFWMELSQKKDTIKFAKKPRGVIIPHGIELADDTAAFFRGLKNTFTPNNIFLIGANTSGNIIQSVATCKDCLFETGFGDVNIDHERIENFLDNKIGESSDAVFKNSKSILFAMPFLKSFFPDSFIFPIVVQPKNNITDMVKLKNWLKENVTEDDLIVLSMNFSGNAPLGFLEINDESSSRTIRNFDFSNVFDLDTEDVFALHVFLGAMEALGAQSSTKNKTLCSQDFSEDLDDELTSYHFWSFYDGVAIKNRGISFLSFGEILKDFELELFSSWNADFENEDNEAFKQLRDIRGGLKGSDFIVFDSKKDECMDLEQNDFKISFCKFFESAEKSDLSLREKYNMVAEKSVQNDFVYVLFEFSGKELSAERSKIAKNFIDFGAGVFLGRGIKGVLPLEVYENALIFYSLGDFLTNSKLANELMSDSKGIILGIDVSEKYYSIYVFPISIDKGYPKFMSGSQKDDIFKNFSSKINFQKDTEIDAGKGLIRIYREM